MRYRYQTKFDNDIKIAKKIKNININIFLLVQEKYIDLSLI